MGPPPDDTCASIPHHRGCPDNCGERWLPPLDLPGLRPQSGASQAHQTSWRRRHAPPPPRRRRRRACPKRRRRGGSGAWRFLHNVWCAREASFCCRNPGRSSGGSHRSWGSLDDAVSMRTCRRAADPMPVRAVPAPFCSVRSWLMPSLLVPIPLISLIQSWRFTKIYIKCSMSS